MESDTLRTLQTPAPYSSPYINVHAVVTWQPCSNARVVIAECTRDPSVAMISFDSTTDALQQSEDCSHRTMASLLYCS